MKLATLLIELRVECADESAAFYEALLGASRTRRDGRQVVFELESPPIVLTLTESPSAGLRKRTVQYVLLVSEPEQIGAAAVALRRRRATLRLHDEGIETQDPDGHPWRVRFAPGTKGRTVMVQ
jgi:catechol-2,3-dioxygenase